MKSEQEFLDFYNSKLKDLLQDFEKKRLETIRKIKSFLLWGVIGLVLIILGFIIGNEFLILILSLPSIFLFGYAYSYFVSMSRDFRRPFKVNIIPVIMGFLHEKFEYIPRQKIAREVIENSNLLNFEVLFVEGEDFMRFKIGETLIMFSECEAYDVRQKLKFSGVFISATFNKNFNAETYVLPRKFSTFLNSLERRLLSKCRNVKLEDAEFNKHFRVLSSDQVEARYILTPSLMQRLIDYKMKTKKGISFSFIHNRLYCAIPNYIDLFEPALLEPFDYKFMKFTYEPIKLYTDLVEDLNLNLRIWSKQ